MRKLGRRKEARNLPQHKSDPMKVELHGSGARQHALDVGHNLTGSVRLWVNIRADQYPG